MSLPHAIGAAANALAQHWAAASPTPLCTLLTSPLPSPSPPNLPFHPTPHPSLAVVLVVSTAMFAYGASIVGLAPRSVCSTWAYFMHMPEDLVWAISGKRPFNYDTIDEHVLVGRMPRSMADIAQLRAEVCAARG